MAFIHKGINVTPGVQTDADFTNQSTTHYVAADKIRFVDGFPEKIGGWNNVPFNGIYGISGCTRNIFSYILSRKINYLIGTNSNLYSLTDNNLINMTPLETSGATYNGDVSTTFGTLVSNPITTTISTSLITIADVATLLKDGDSVTLSGAVGFNGISTGAINSTFIVQNATTNTFDVDTQETATSSGSGGGASVVRATKLVVIDQANTFNEGDNINITGFPAPIGGIPASEINADHRVRNTTSISYVISVSTTATSSVTQTSLNLTITPQIEDGLCDPTVGAGYGLGLYGAGLYGVSKTAAAAALPRIWSFDRFGSLVIFTPGSAGKLYSWNSSTSLIPVAVTNAPTSINYAFETDNIAVTLGAGGIPNRVQWSDQGNLTTWTATEQNRAGQDDIEGVDEFITHLPVRGLNLLFTKSKTHTMRFIDRPFVFEFKELDPTVGIIARNARVSVNGVGYWMGVDNWYQYRGGKAEITGSNTTSQTTLKKEVFDTINREHESKIFGWYNESFNEIWWHYPKGTSTECNAIARFNIRDLTWTTDTMDRTAGEYPFVLGRFPRTIDKSNRLYDQESGNDADGSNLPFSLSTHFFDSGKTTIDIKKVIPDSIQTGSINLAINTKGYPQGPVTTNSDTITPATEFLDGLTIGRYWQYTISGNETGQSWRAGSWREEVQEGSDE